jgi:hypothetical protein
VLWAASKEVVEQLEGNKTPPCFVCQKEIPTAEVAGGYVIIQAGEERGSAMLGRAKSRGNGEGGRAQERPPEIYMTQQHSTKSPAAANKRRDD